jgi:hypothetical protein
MFGKVLPRKDVMGYNWHITSLTMLTSNFITGQHLHTPFVLTTPRLFSTSINSLVAGVLYSLKSGGRMGCVRTILTTINTSLVVSCSLTFSTIEMFITVRANLAVFIQPYRNAPAFYAAIMAFRLP